MSSYPFEKKPAFFPFISTEIFFEASDQGKSAGASKVADEALDAELDKILGLREKVSGERLNEAA